MAGLVGSGGRLGLRAGRSRVGVGGRQGGAGWGGGHGWGWAWWVGGWAGMDRLQQTSIQSKRLYVMVE